MSTVTYPPTRQDMERNAASETQHPVYDVCIVGAGVAGSALAWHLGRHGVEVAIVERDLAEPDKFIGELLQPGGVMMLEALGYTDVLEGFDAQPVEGYALFNNGDHFNIPYSTVNGQRATGRGFRYGKFIMSLRKKLEALPNVTVIEGSVNELLMDVTTSGVVYRDKEMHQDITLEAGLTVVCDGGFSKFRGELNHSERITKGFMVGLLLKDCELPYPGHGHVFMSGKSPFLAYPVSSNETRVLVDFPGQASPKQGGQAAQYFQEIKQHIPASMHQAYEAAISDSKIKAMPASLLVAKPEYVPGFITLGDALNMRHPLTGGGMTAALTDVKTLGDLLLQIDNYRDTRETGRAISEFYTQRHRDNSTINILADALYDVMTYPDLKDACYRYLARGEKYTNGPVSVLSAVSRDQQLLIREFFAVALYGAGTAIKETKGPGKAHKIIREALHIIKPLLLNEQPSSVTKAALQFGQILFPKPVKP